MDDLIDLGQPVSQSLPEGKSLWNRYQIKADALIGNKQIYTSIIPAAVVIHYIPIIVSVNAYLSS